jgi:Uma2 family endonuclease
MTTSATGIPDVQPVAVYSADPALIERLKAERQALGLDRYDEVWEGVYVMNPLPNNEHQRLDTRLTIIFGNVIDPPGLGEVFQGVNVSDRNDGWVNNYREPDVAVFLKGTRAIDRGTHWEGGPDFLVETLSPGDSAREKLPFYAQIGVREVLLIDREPWALELYRRQEGQLALAGQSTLGRPEQLSSTVLPLSFRLIPGDERPRIEVSHHDGVQRWVV